MKRFFIFIGFLFTVLFLYLSLNCVETVVADNKDKDNGLPLPPWPKRLGGTAGDGGYCIRADLIGNIVVSGFVNGNADLNGDGDAVDAGGESGANYGSSDSFITKFNSSGTWQWFKRLGNSSSDSAHGITTDGSSDVIVTGTVYGYADLNSDGDSSDGGAESGGGIFTTSSDIYIKKFRQLSVELMGKRLGGANEDISRSVTADASSDIIGVGIIKDAADLDGDRLISGGLPETGSGSGQDIYVTKFERTLNTCQWAKRLGGVNDDCGMCAAADKDKNVAVVGYVTGAADFNGNGNSTDNAEETTGYGQFDVLISVFDKSGVLLWSQRLGGAGNDYGYSAAFDSSGNLFVTGVVNGDADLNGDGDSSDTGGGESASGFGGDDIFVAKFNSSGTCLWSKRLGGTSYDTGRGITVDISGNVIITGYADGDVDLNGDGDKLDDGESAAGYGGYDIFIAKFDSSGSGLWTKRLGGANADYGYSVTTDADQNVYITGNVTGAADLNGNGNSTDNTLESGGLGNADIIIVKFDSGGTPL